MTEKIIMAGFGGQGILSMGRIISEGALLQGVEVSWFPSYGAEMRGGTANCHVIISDKLIGSPLVSADADIVFVMNNPSLTKFENIVKPGGILLVNSSLVTFKPTREDINIHYIPATKIALESGSEKSSNVVMLGAYSYLNTFVKAEFIESAIDNLLSKRKKEYKDVNEKAFECGKNYLKK